MATALITGASSGIGAQLAQQLAARGYHLLLVARRAERLQQLAAELQQQHGIHVGVLPCDLGDTSAIDPLMQQADAWLATHNETLTLLANNAGTGYWDEFSRQQPAQLAGDIALNISALTLLSHAFVTRALAHGQPAWLLNIASLAALLPAPRFAVYSASKDYVLKFSEVLAHELRDSAISVTCVCPGGVITEFLDHAGQELKGDLGMMSAEEVARLSLNALFAGKLIYIPGLLNKTSSLVRFLPRPLRHRLVERSMRLTVKPK